MREAARQPWRTASAPAADRGNARARGHRVPVLPGGIAVRVDAHVDDLRWVLDVATGAGEAAAMAVHSCSCPALRQRSSRIPGSDSALTAASLSRAAGWPGVAGRVRSAAGRGPRVLHPRVDVRSWPWTNLKLLVTPTRERVVSRPESGAPSMAHRTTTCLRLSHLPLTVRSWAHPIGRTRRQDGEIVPFENDADQDAALVQWNRMTICHPAAWVAGAYVIIGPTTTSYVDLSARTVTQSRTADGSWQPSALSDFTSLPG